MLAPKPRLYSHGDPQKMRAPGGVGGRICPVRPDHYLLSYEGPHALSWLAARGTTIRLKGRA